MKSQLFSKNNHVLQISTLALLSLSFLFVCSTLLITQNLKEILTLWGDSMQMTVYLQDGLTDESLKQIQNSLHSDERIAQVDYIPKEKALQQFREQMASYAPGLLNDKDLLKFIPSSFQLSLSDLSQQKDELLRLKSVATSLQSLNGVEEIAYGQDWVQQFSWVLKLINGIGGLVITLLVVSTVFIVGHCVQSSIIRRREEVEILELIGATNMEIRKPFLIEGASLGFFSSLIGLLACLSGFVIFKKSFEKEMTLLQMLKHVHFLHFTTFSAVVLCATGLGLLSAWICIKQMNTGWSASSRLQEEV